MHQDGIQLRVGDTVILKSTLDQRRGRIVSFKAFHGTVLVKWESTKELRYHLPRDLEAVKK
jgi:hypothetical protein